jgi:hypothetical protein|nr:MAG TPA: hypothetical protein [Caudoviricetes sp.]
MTIKNALNSEECKELRKIIGQTNAIIIGIRRMNKEEETQKAANFMQEALKILCKQFGDKLNETLTTAQSIEAEEGGAITFLGAPKDYENENRDKKP